MFPFSKVPQGQNVVVWGKGSIGTQFYKELTTINYANKIFWVDTDSVENEQDFIEKRKESYFVIGILSDRIRTEITTKLLGCGIKTEYIINDKPQSIVFSPSWCARSEEKDLCLLNDKVQKEINRFYELSKIKNTVGYDFVRVGAANDGGYVMLDDLPGGVAYSFGINDDVTWDDDMASRGYEVYMYDYTIDALPYEKDGFHFFKEGIADFEESDNLKKLETFIKRNGHEKNGNMILKIDVEGAEWGVFENIPANLLKRFNQIVVEFHDLFDFNNLARYNDVFEKISKIHQPVHYHINNYGDVYWFNDKPFGNAIEVTFANKEKYVFLEGEIELPRSQDAPNCKEIDEITVGSWNTKKYCD